MRGSSNMQPMNRMTHTLNSSCCLIRFFGGISTETSLRKMLAALEENTAVSWWVFAEKSLHASSLGKESPVVAEKLTNPYK